MTYSDAYKLANTITDMEMDSIRHRLYGYTCQDNDKVSDVKMFFNLFGTNYCVLTTYLSNKTLDMFKAMTK